MGEEMSERLEYFAADAVTFRYICKNCQTELVIKPGQKLHIGNGEAHCPGCHGRLMSLRAALEKYREFCEIAKSLPAITESVNRDGDPEKPGELKFQVVIPERQSTQEEK
jgi:DNA-directed RNA polymerase subunit RPC12/RpoP